MRHFFIAILFSVSFLSAAAFACTTDEDCGEFSNCDYQPASGSASLCVPAPTSGPCAFDHKSLCGRDASGVFSWCDSSGVCRAQSGACDVNAPESCGLNQWCDGSSRCRARSTEVGAPCDAQNPDSCALTLWCRSGSRTCQRPGALGEVCEAMNPDSCQGDLWCASGRCRPPGQNGGTCDASIPYSCGWGLVCANGLCRAPEKCDPNTIDACAPGLSCIGLNCTAETSGPAPGTRCSGYCKGPSGLFGDCDPRYAQSCGPGLYCTPSFYCARVLANRDARAPGRTLPGLMNVLKGVAATDPDAGSSPERPANTPVSPVGSVTSGGSFGGAVRHGENESCQSALQCAPGLFCARALCLDRTSGQSDQGESVCDSARPLREPCDFETDRDCRCQDLKREGEECLPLTCLDDRSRQVVGPERGSRLLCVAGSCRHRAGRRGAEITPPGSISCATPSGGPGEVYFCDRERPRFTLSDPHAPWVCANSSAALSGDALKRSDEFAEAACLAGSGVLREPPSTFPVPHTHAEGQSCGENVSCRVGLACDHGVCARPALPEAPVCRASFEDVNPLQDGVQYGCCASNWRGECSRVAYYCNACAPEKIGRRCIDREKNQNDIDRACGAAD